MEKKFLKIFFLIFKKKVIVRKFERIFIVPVQWL